MPPLEDGAFAFSSLATSRGEAEDEVALSSFCCAAIVLAARVSSSSLRWAVALPAELSKLLFRYVDLRVGFLGAPRAFQTCGDACAWSPAPFVGPLLCVRS